MTSRFLQAALGIAATSYLDAKYGIGYDVKLGIGSALLEKQ
jgi:hypothetical protein